MDGVADAEETTPGGFIALNEDDDDGDGVIDCNDGYNKDGIPGNDDDENQDEDDLVKITLNEVLPTDLPIDDLRTVELDVIAGGSKIRIWESQTNRSTPITLPAYYVNRSLLPDELWVEGIDTSSDPCDIKLEMKYNIDGHTFDDRINVTVVKINYVTVDANATQTNVTGPKNWAAVKESVEYVIVKAVLDPNISEFNVPDGLITWTGGDPVAGHPLKRKVSKATSAKTRVTATCGSSDYVDIWILWADVEIKMTGTTPANAVQFYDLRDGTENLGTVYYYSGSKASGKIVAIGTITPSGVHNVVEVGWEIHRDKFVHPFKDGVKDPTQWTTDWTDDTSHSFMLMLNPDPNDQIFDTDAPTCVQGSAQDSSETYVNFRQWIEWNNDEVASDKYEYWYWQGRWKKGENPEITLKEVGSGTIELPDEDEAYYDPP